MDERAREEWLADRQDGRVYPIGRALRSTFDADNHDSLGTDVTGLMIDLSKMAYGGDDGIAPLAVPPASPIEPQPAALARPPSMFSRLTGLIGRR